MTDANPPDHSPTRKVIQTLGAAAVGGIPLVGGSLAVIMVDALNYKLNKRREEWFTDLANDVEELKTRFDGFDPANLAENDVFVDAVVGATRIIEHTSQQEKIDALRSAVLNSALPNAPEEDIQALFFKLIDDLTPTHLHLLVLLHDPKGWFERANKPRQQFGSRRDLVQAALPELAGQGNDVIDRFFAGLSSGGLMNIGSLGGMMTADGVWQSASSDFAKRFLDFITDPLAQQED